MATERPKITEWIQASAVVVGVVFAIYEFRLADATSRRSQAEQVAALAKAASTEVIVNSASEVLRLKLVDPDPNKDPIDVIRLMTPYHEHLKLWAFCYDSNLCTKSLAISYACDRVLAYEDTAYEIFEKYNLNYMLENRPLRSTQFWKDCQGLAK